MKIDFTEELLDSKFKPIMVTDKDHDGEFALTFGYAADIGLNSTNPKKEMSGTDKVKRFRLAERINLSVNGASKGDCILDLKEMALVEEAIGEIYNIPVSGAVARIIERLNAEKPGPELVDKPKDLTKGQKGKL